MGRDLGVSRSLSQLICHLGEAGHGAFLVAFGARPAHPHGADRLVTDLDWDTAAQRDDVGEFALRGELGHVDRALAHSALVRPKVRAV